MEPILAERLVLEAGGWRSPPLAVALSPVTRWRGLAPHPMGGALLIWARSVHARTMMVPLTVTRIDRAGVVEGTHRLAPGGVLWFHRAAWNLEMPADAALPPPGAALAVRPMLDE